MRIATFNVNGVNGRLPVLLRWLAETQPDVAVLQELKAPDAKFPAAAIRAAGYEPIWHGQPRWNGVALLSRVGAPVILLGDFNVMPTDLDVYKPERWLDDALFVPEVRALYARLLAQGWTDAIRHLHPGKRVYTFWDYLRHAWPRDAGLRLDHLLLSPALAPRLAAAGVDREVRGWDHASDHAPAWVELGPARRRRTKSD